MKNVQAVACDMNANFADTFTEACPHIRIVYDHFHIVKNFNEKVVSEVRKDEYRRLMDEGRTAEAQKLKRSRFILTASRKTLAKRDKEAKEGKAYGRNSKLFNLQSKPKKDGNLIKYEALLEENKLFFTCDIIKDYLDRAYKDTGEIWKNRLMMGKYLHAIMRHCRASQNKHMIWFAKLIDDHYKGIISYATFPIASGKIEGINQKIKTVRREGYGYPDDEYFFLKIMDFTRKEYVRNPKSHILSRDVLKAIDLHNAQKEALQETGAA